MTVGKLTWFFKYFSCRQMREKNNLLQNANFVWSENFCVPMLQLFQMTLHFSGKQNFIMQHCSAFTARMRFCPSFTERLGLSYYSLNCRMLPATPVTRQYTPLWHKLTYNCFLEVNSKHCGECTGKSTKILCESEWIRR